MSVTASQDLENDSANQSQESLQDQSEEQTIANSVMNEQITKIHEAFHRGDIQSAKHLIASVDEKVLSEAEEKQLLQYKQRLRFDSVELYLPIALFVFWAFIFWKTVH